MSPCSHKSSENAARSSILEVIWGHFGHQVGTKFDFRCVFFEVRILVKTNGTIPKRPKSPKSPGQGGWGFLKEFLETGG